MHVHMYTIHSCNMDTCGSPNVHIHPKLDGQGCIYKANHSRQCYNCTYTPIGKYSTYVYSLRILIDISK